MQLIKLCGEGARERGGERSIGRQKEREHMARLCVGGEGQEWGIYIVYK